MPDRSPAEETSLIVGFARQLLGSASATDPKEEAAARGWLDAAGLPTEDGRKLIDSLTGQDGTRSVFRNY